MYIDARNKDVLRNRVITNSIPIPSDVPINFVRSV